MAIKQQRKSHRKAILLIAPLILLLAAGSAYGLYYQRNHKAPTSGTTTRPINSVSYGPSSPSDNTANNQRKNSSSSETTLNTNPSAPSATFSAQIVSANVSSGNVHIGTLVSDTTSGTCTLTASQAGQQDITLDTTSVQLDVNNYDCGTLNIPTSKFTASGKWELTLTVSNNGQQTTTTTDITIPSGS